tara:strand:+ start:568 stop:1692 length:1125 start_codon:yes stop_codon:yes gene_type:complete
MKKVAIVGGGISGLYLANELNKENEVDYKIFEKKEYFNLNEGYGIQLSVNSIKLLNKIGFKNISASDVYYPTKVNFFQANSINKICEIDLKQFNNDYDRYTTLKRSTLLKFLFDNIPNEKIQFNAKIKNIEYNEKIEISYDNNKEKFDYLVIADGVFSKFKSQISKNTLKPFFNGNIALRANLKQHERDNISIYMGSNFHYVTYPVNQKLEYNFVAIIKKKLNDEEIENKNILNSEIFLKSLKDFITKNSKLNLENLIDLKCFPIFVSPGLPILKYQNTFLSGDALFAFPPSFAQGASQSIETANSILENITNSNNIYKDRINKILLVNKRSKFNHFAFHLTNPIIIMIRNLILKYLSKNKKFLESYLGTIYRN